MRITLDRGSALSLRQQLRGAIEHEIAFAGRVAGDPLPSVRELADQLGVAPVTISKVYAELKADGLIETRSGSGTYVADSWLARVAGRGEMPHLRRRIDSVIDLALKAGCSPADLLSMFNARVTHRLAPLGRKHVVMLGIFEDATASYARCVEDRVGHLATVEPATIGQIAADAAMADRVRAADLVLTFANLEDRIGQLVPQARVVLLRFIPSEATRLALAAIDPMRRVGVVSRFAEFLPVVSLGVRRFAAHLQSVTAHVLDDPDLPAALADREVLVLSTGADAAARHAPRGIQAIEYRHIPDPGDIDRRVIPHLLGTGLSSDGGIKDIKEAS